MRRIFTERSLVVFLFVVALIVFTMASEDARNLQARTMQASGRYFPAASPQMVEVVPGGTSAARD